MGSSVRSVDIVCKGQNVGVVAVVILQGYLNGRFFSVTRIVDNVLMQNIPNIFLFFMDIADKTADTAFVMQYLADRFFSPFVAEGDVDTAV